MGAAAQRAGAGPEQLRPPPPVTGCLSGRPSRGTAAGGAFRGSSGDGRGGLPMTASTAPTKSSTAALAPLPAAVNRPDHFHAMLRRLNLSHIAGTFTATALKAAKTNLSPQAVLY